MKNEFATFEQALALKELGYDKRCIAYYTADTKKLSLVQGYGGELMFADYVHLANTSFVKSVPCPLKQQLFRWFREKYDLSGIIDLHVSAPSHWYVRIDVIEINDFIYHSEDEHKYFTTYEEAENACIDKLIEILKQQDNG